MAGSTIRGAISHGGTRPGAASASARETQRYAERVNQHSEPAAKADVRLEDPKFAKSYDLWRAKQTRAALAAYRENSLSRGNALTRDQTVDDFVRSLRGQ